MKRSILSILLLIFIAFNSKANQHYDNAFSVISNMLSDSIESDFKRAVYEVENAFYDNNLIRGRFYSEIKALSHLTKSFAIANERNLVYDGDDRNEILLHASLFKLFTDSIPLIVSDSNQISYLNPYKYKFQDAFGKADWSNMFVSKLIAERKGNCHSMAYLYQIISNELGIKSNLSFAPFHIYVKVKSQKSGFFNVELTNGTFPNDAWIISSGYIHLDAIRNSLYMDTLSTKETIAICLFDLAKGYERKFGMKDGEFVLKCCDKVLEHYPNHINTLILKSKVLLSQKVNSKREKKDYKNAEEFAGNNYVGLISKIHKLGYRRMPEEMYLRWITSLPEEENGLKVLD